MLRSSGQRRAAQGLLAFIAMLILARCGPSSAATSPTAPAPEAPAATTSGSQATTLEPCVAASQVRLLQSPEPVAPTAPPPTATNPTPAPPTHTPAPAPNT